MSAVPSPITPLDLPETPPLVSLGLEFERRGMQAPPQVQALTHEYRRRGLTGQTALSNQNYDLTGDARDTRAALRLDQIASQYQPPTGDAREAYVRERTGEFLQRQEQNYMQSERFRQEWDSKPWGVRAFEAPYLTTTQRLDLYGRLGDSVDKAREQFGVEFDRDHTPEAEFIRQRDDNAQFLAQSYREANPDASDQDVYRYMHQELARLGFQPHFAGQFGATVDQEALRADLEQIRLDNRRTVDQLPPGAQQVYAAGTGFVKSFQDSLGTFAGTVGAGGISEFLERTTGDDWGFRDQQRAIEHYWTQQAQDNAVLGTSEQEGVGGTLNRFSELMGGVVGDLAQTIVAANVGAGGAKAAQLSARLQSLTAQLSGMGFMGVKEGGGAYRSIYQSLREQGFDHADANQRALWSGLGVGLVNAMLEKAPLDEFVLANPGTMNRLRGAMRGFVVEGSQEMSQELVNVLAEFQSGASDGQPLVSWDNTERILIAGLAGGLIGGPVGAVTGGQGVRGDLTTEADIEAQVRASIDNARRRTEQELQARESDTPRPDQDGSPPSPEVGPETTPPTSGGRRDPKVIATPRQLGQWYAKTFDDAPNAALIESMAESGGRFRLVDIPMNAVESLETASPGEVDVSKVEAISQLSAQEVADLPPIIAIGDGTAPLQIIDGNHRFKGLQSRGDAVTIRGYVPEAVAQQIEAGAFQAGPPETAPPTPEVTPETTPEEAGPGPDGREDAERATGRGELEPGRREPDGDGPPTPEPPPVDEGGVQRPPNGEGPGRAFPNKIDADTLGQLTGALDADTDAEIEANQAFQRGQIADAVHGEGTWVKVRVPVSTLTASPREGERVERYAAQDAAGAPPIVAAQMKGGSGGLEVIDGNNRVAAAQARGESEVVAYIPENDVPLLQRGIIEDAEAIVGRLRESIDRLAREARTNPLTGGLNRREFDRLLGQAAREADRTGQGFAVIAFDAANLKTVNDTQGDAAGDAYLKATFEAIEEVTRSGTPGSGPDSSGGERRADAFHYGGDEFAVLLTGLPPDQADALAAQVRDRAEGNAGREEVVPGVSTFLVGESSVYTPGAGRVSALLPAATDAMKARKKRMKAEAGEATTREGAEEARRRSETITGRSEPETTPTVDTEPSGTSTTPDDPNGPDPETFAADLIEQVENQDITINEAINEVRAAYPGGFGLSFEMPEGADREISRERGYVVVRRLIGDYDTNDSGVNVKDEADAIDLLAGIKGRKNLKADVYVSSTAKGYWTFGYDFTGPQSGSSSPMSLFGPWYGSRAEALAAAMNRARHFAEGLIQSTNPATTQASGRRMLKAIEAQQSAMQGDQAGPEVTTESTPETGQEGTVSKRGKRLVADLPKSKQTKVNAIKSLAGRLGIPVYLDEDLPMTEFHGGGVATATDQWASEMGGITDAKVGDVRDAVSLTRKLHPGVEHRIYIQAKSGDGGQPTYAVSLYGRVPARFTAVPGDGDWWTVRDSTNPDQTYSNMSRELAERTAARLNRGEPPTQEPTDGEQIPTDEAETPTTEPDAEQGPEGEPEEDLPAEQTDADAESSLIETDTGDADATVWLERDAPESAKADILKKWERAGRAKLRGPKLGRTKATTRKPARASSQAAFAARLAKLARRGGEGSGGAIWTPTQALVTDGNSALRVTEKTDRRFTASQFKNLSPPDARDGFDTIVNGMVANAGTPTATGLDLATAIRWARQASVMTDDEYGAAVMVVNRDGTIGLAVGNPNLGTAEINVDDGYRELEAGIDPRLLRDTLEAMYAGGIDTVDVYTDGVGERQPFIFIGEDGQRRIEALVMRRNFGASDVPSVERVRGRGQQAGTPAGVVGSPMADLGFSPQTGQTLPEGEGVTGPDDTLDNTGGYTQDYNPLDENSGKFRRTRADTPRKIKASIAKARARRGGKAVAEADNIYRIIEDVARRFNLGPPGVGRARMLARWAAGFYRLESESVRLRRGSYVATFFHEVGHHLHKVMFPRSGNRRPADIRAHDFPRAWWPELQVLGKDLYGDRKPKVGGYVTEGWAEVVRFLLVNPKHLKERAPTLYRAVTRTLVTEHPEAWMVMKDARLRLLNAVELGTDNPMTQVIDRTGGRADFNLSSLKDDLRIRLFDRFHRLQTFKSDLNLDNVPAHLDPHTMALRANGHISGDVKLVMERGIFDPADPARRKTGKGLVEILRPVRQNIELWEDYMVARRTLEKRAQGYDVLPQDPRIADQFSNARLRDFIGRAEATHPEFKPVAEDFQTFNRWLIEDFAVHYGLVSPDAAKLIVEKNLEYITFRHKKTEDALARSYGAKSSKGGFTGQGSGIRRFRGGLGEELFPPIEAFMSSMQGIISRARLNQVAGQVTNAYEKGIDGAGRWMDRIDRPMEANHVKAEQLGEEIRKQLGIGLTEDGQIVLPAYLESLTDDQVGSLLDSLVGLEGATFWKPGNFVDRDARQVTVLRDGKPVFYEIKDKRMYDLLEGLHNPAGANLFVKVIGLPGRVLRAGATQFNPSFFVPNFLRDLNQALSMTETQLRALPQQTRLRFEGMRQAFLGGDIHELFLAAGADMSGIFGEYYDPRKNRLDFDRMFEQPRALGLIKGDDWKGIARDLIRLGPIDRLNRSFELANRLGEFAVAYEQAQERGASEAEALAEAGQAAADITLDFQRGGTWSKQANEVIVFFNAAMLGAGKLARWTRKNPHKAMGRIFTFTILPSMLSLLLNADNEDYWAKPQGQRDRYWYFPTGHDDQGRPTYLKIPKPYGLGAFSIAFERTFGRLFAIDPETGERGDLRAFDDMGHAILREFRPTLNIAGLQPLVEVMAGDQGWSFYRDREIVSNADADLPLGEQGASRSSELARVLGRWMDYPPAKIDYLISGWTGGLGRDAVQVGIDPIIRAVNGDADQGEPLEFSDWLVVRRFLAGHTRSGHEAITRFFDDYERFKRISRGLSTREGDTEQYERYQQRHAAALEMWPLYTSAQRRMGQQFARVRELYRNPDEYDPDELDRLVTEHYDRIIEIARETHTLRRDAEQTQE